MELYLDSAKIDEVKDAATLGLIDGLTTTPTFMNREGVKDIDETVLLLASLVPVLQIEALGRTSDEIVADAARQHALGLQKSKTVFKIPVSLEGARACKRLTDDGFLVNIHLVYTLQQAYLAMKAGATYVCPLVGRLQDQGADALGLLRACCEMKRAYRFSTKIMFSSVRNIEHIRDAIVVGADACTIPWKLMSTMADNHLTELHTEQFFKDTRMLKIKAAEAMKPLPLTNGHIPMAQEALQQMAESNAAFLAVFDPKESTTTVISVLDVMSAIKDKGLDALKSSIEVLGTKQIPSIHAQQSLSEAANLFKQNSAGHLVVMEDDRPVGILARADAA